MRTLKRRNRRALFLSLDHTGFSTRKVPFSLSQECLIYLDLGLLARRNCLTMTSLEKNVRSTQDLKGAPSMTYTPTPGGFMKLEDSEKLLRTIFPNYPNLQPCHSAPTLEAVSQGNAESGDQSVSRGR